ncbi:hypothetical protein BRARA_I05158 [Brassica rapa]|uniref:Uncharacterized protein n=1 Tax=Brassica campestris TaxID=3711 RepID=A0A397Y4W8_BRACM|nr:hypothetical protein BRARA_I05158 [Brassica rapa]
MLHAMEAAFFQEGWKPSTNGGEFDSIASCEASSRNLSRGFCVSIMILVTYILLPFCDCSFLHVE